jgi:D-glycero-alpha-D-manno-heptose 1-phosphate guanylyltransferase
MRDFDRYGAVLIEDNIIKAFDEKKYYKKAHINCGLYIIKKSLFDKVKLNTNFSFEEFIEDNLNILHPLAYISNNSYFIDIGIPDDYKKAQVDFKELF